MAGHSKWAQIKRSKAITDAKRSAVFTKLAKNITVAVKAGGGGDPTHNFKLKTAIEKAKEALMPKANIERAIEKAIGSKDGNDIKEICYEGYLPGGVAVMIFCATDNTNRSYNDVRTIFNKANGSLSSPGSVAYLFNKDACGEFIPLHTVLIDNQDSAKNILKAMEALDDHDDVIEVVANFELAADLAI